MCVYTLGYTLIRATCNMFFIISKHFLKRIHSGHETTQQFLLVPILNFTSGSFDTDFKIHTYLKIFLDYAHHYSCFSQKPKHLYSSWKFRMCFLLLSYDFSMLKENYKLYGKVNYYHGIIWGQIFTKLNLEAFECYFDLPSLCSGSS